MTAKAQFDQLKAYLNEYEKGRRPANQVGKKHQWVFHQYTAFCKNCALYAHKPPRWNVKDGGPINADNCGNLPGRWKSADVHLRLSGLDEQQRRVRYDGGGTRWSLYKAEETKELIASRERQLAAQKKTGFDRAEWNKTNREKRNARLRARMAAETEEEKAARRERANQRRAKRVAKTEGREVARRRGRGGIEKQQVQETAKDGAGRKRKEKKKRGRRQGPRA